MSDNARRQPPDPLPDPFLRLRAGDIALPPPVFVSARDSVAHAAASMAVAGATAALVRAAADAGTAGDALQGGSPLGIVTERDVLTRVVAAGRDASTTTVAEAMTFGLVDAKPDDLLIEAYARMVRRKVRRLVLLDASGRALGLLGEGDILAARGESPLALAGEIDAAPDASALARAFGRLARLAGRCVAEGLGSEPVGRLISEMHDRIMSRAWGLALAETEAAHGPAPAPHAVAVLGSQARREQYLATDQDLALVYADDEGGDDAAPWFAALGVRLTALLLAAGFPPCPRRVMLDNPDWRRGQRAWLNHAEGLAERPDAEAVVAASLLADLRPLPEPPTQSACPSALRMAAPELARRLRAELTQRFSGSALLLKLMAREAVRFSPPLGLFRGLSLKRDEQGRGSLDVKRGGVFPITQGIKTLALERGLSDTGTLPRLAGLAQAGALDPALAGGLGEALNLLQTLRMRAQADALARGLPPDNTLRPDELGALEREALRGAFKLVGSLQELLASRFALHLLG